MNSVIAVAPSAAMADVSLARGVVRRVRAVFDATAQALGRRCARRGKLDSARLDANQFATYELALACADLVAAETALDGHHATPLDARLALIFVTSAIRQTLARLDALGFELADARAAETGADDEGAAGKSTAERSTAAESAAIRAALDALAASSEWADLRRDALRAESLAATGRAVAAAGGDVGHVALSESLQMAQDAFRRFADDVVAPKAYEIHRHDLTVSEELLQPMREMGVFGLAIPEQFGGSAPGGDEDALMMVVVTEALSEASLAAAGSLITRPEILARALLAGGTAEQKAEWLPKIAAGDPLCAIAITEPDYGSDVASLALRATPTAGGWLLNGAKTWCTFAGKAGLLMVVARTNPDRAAGYRGLSVFLVEKPSYEGHDFDFAQASGGRVSGRAIRTIGYRGMHSFDLAFDDYFVPEDHVIGGAGGVGKGFYYTMAGMVGGRMQTAARALGVMRAAIRAAIRYAEERKVFDAPLADFQLTQVKLAEMASRFAACRKLAYAVGRRLGSGDSDGKSGDGRVEAAIAKLLACRSAETVTREAQQIHGGMGYAEETAVSRYFVDARVLSIFEGAEETLALKVIARGLLERALADAASARGAAGAATGPDAAPA
jgi:(2S)-methylsuccinyl-CoA dehydrogenase